MHNIKYHQEELSMKHVSAIITALVITAIVGLGIMVVGVSALTNTNTVPLQNSPNTSVSGNNQAIISSNSTAPSASTGLDIQQLQQQVSNLQSQLDQASQVLQQYQSLIVVLQQRGLIYIDNNGNIYLPQGSSDTSH
jgi:TolA-binding protein